MREIKFRAWDSDGEYMFVPDHFLKNGKGFDCWDGQQEGFVYTEHLMQFTGLSDKNRKPIYEGDVIRKKLQYSNQGLYQIVFQEGCFVGLSKDGDKYGPFTTRLANLGASMSIQVVGNIHQNPELLEQSK